MTGSEGEAVRAVWKFHLEVTDTQAIKMPIGAIPLHAGINRNRLWLWALVDIDAEDTRRVFKTFRTGQNINQGGLSYVSTYQSLDDTVFHLFDAGCPGNLP